MADHVKLGTVPFIQLLRDFQDGTACCLRHCADPPLARDIWERALVTQDAEGHVTVGEVLTTILAAAELWDSLPEPADARVVKPEWSQTWRVRISGQDISANYALETGLDIVAAALEARRREEADDA